MYWSKNKMRLGLVIVLTTLFLSSCSDKNEIFDFSANYRYFPLGEGQWVVYEVEKITIDKPIELRDTLRYEQKEIITGKFVDAAHDTAWRIEVYTRLHAGEGWRISGIQSASLNTIEAQKVEDNIRYVKIKFPLAIDKTWDGNRYNQLDTLKYFSYRISALDEPERIHGILFDSVLTVMQKEDSSLIHKLVFKEQYAAGVGLIFKQEVDILSNDAQFDPTEPIEERITTGTLYTMKIKSYGLKSENRSSAFIVPE